MKEAEVNGRKCLIRENIDMDYVDPKTNKTNRELMAKGRTPYDAETGEKIELHHIGQDSSSPLAELTEKEHKNNFSVLHQKEGESWRHNKQLNDRYNNVERPNHWKTRSKE